MLPDSILLEDWIDPQHLQNEDFWLKTKPFEHCVVTHFFKESVFDSLRKSCQEINESNYEIHPTGEYRFAALPCVEFFKFIYSVKFRQFLRSKLSFNFKPCRAFPCPQIYRFDTNKKGVNIHNDYDISQRRDFGMIIYLHNDWQPKFGGELQLFDKSNLQHAYSTILPLPNSIVGFRVHEGSYHSVRPSNCDWERMSIVVDWNID